MSCAEFRWLEMLRLYGCADADGASHAMVLLERLSSRKLRRPAVRVEADAARSAGVFYDIAILQLAQIVKSTSNTAVLEQLRSSCEPVRLC